MGRKKKKQQNEEALSDEDEIFSEEEDDDSETEYLVSEKAWQDIIKTFANDKTQDTIEDSDEQESYSSEEENDILKEDFSYLFKKNDSSQRKERQISTDNVYSRYVRSIRPYSPLPTAELNKLFEIYHSENSTEEEKNRAKERIILHNLRFVITTTKKYLNKGVPSMDLIQEGNIGLIKAIDKYDYKKGFKFSTYAVWWIKQSAQRAIQNTSRTIRLPIHICDLLSRSDRVAKQLELELGRAPTVEEIAKKINRPSVTAKAIQEARDRSGQIISMDVPINGDDSEQTANIGSFMPDTGTENPEEYAMKMALHDSVKEILKQLPEKERVIIEARYGFREGGPVSINDICDELNIKKEEYKSLERKALIAMRPLMIQKGLNAYIAE